MEGCKIGRADTASVNLVNSIINDSQIEKAFRSFTEILFISKKIKFDDASASAKVCQKIFQGTINNLLKSSGSVLPVDPVAGANSWSADDILPRRRDSLFTEEQVMAFANKMRGIGRNGAHIMLYLLIRHGVVASSKELAVVAGLRPNQTAAVRVYIHHIRVALLAHGVADAVLTHRKGYSIKSGHSEAIWNIFPGLRQ